MRAAECGDSTSRSVVCPNCGYAVEQDWSFCSCCGHQLGNNHPSPSSSFESPARHATSISTSDLPNVVGVPGRIIGVKISHGWAATYGYFDIHEVADGRALKTRKISPARGGGHFPVGWFDDQSVKFDDAHQMRLAAILQNVRYCDADKRQDRATVVKLNNDSLSMRVTFEDALGNLKFLDVHADAERGQDEVSRRARDVIRVIEDAFGNSRAIDSLLVIHRRGPLLQVVMNAPLYAHIGPACGDAYSVVDCDSEDVLTIEINELGADERFLEAQIFGLRDGWVSGKAMFPIEDGAVVRLKPEDFAREGWWDEAVLDAPRPREGVLGREEWVIACASWPYGFEKIIDTTPFLGGYEPFVISGSYAVKTWLDYHDEDQDAWFARPLPDKVDLIDPPYLPSVHGDACNK